MNRVFRVKTTTVHERFDDESVIVNLENGRYYSAQGTGDAVWSAMAEGRSQADIVAGMLAAYPGRTDVGELVAAFLDEAVSENLVEVQSVPTDAADSTPVPVGSPGGAFQPPVLEKYSDMEELLLHDPIHEVDEAGWPIRPDAE